MVLSSSATESGRGSSRALGGKFDRTIPVPRLEVAVGVAVAVGVVVGGAVAVEVAVGVTLIVKSSCRVVSFTPTPIPPRAAQKETRTWGAMALEPAADRGVLLGALRAPVPFHG